MASSLLYTQIHTHQCAQLFDALFTVCGLKILNVAGIIKDGFGIADGLDGHGLHFFVKEYRISYVAPQVLAVLGGGLLIGLFEIGGEVRIAAEAGLFCDGLQGKRCV